MLKFTAKNIKTTKKIKLNENFIDKNDKITEEDKMLQNP